MTTLSTLSSNPVALAPARPECGATLTEKTFAAIASMMHRETGIHLARTKLDMVQGRLQRRLRALRIETFEAYLDFVSGPDGAVERGSMINALTTNLTGFFRETHHFDYLEQAILPAFIAAPASGPKRLRIWSSACSSGEEPYSIAMVLCMNRALLRNCDVRILATDIDTEMVATGSAGCYESAKVRSVPEPLRKRFVHVDGDGRTARMADELKALIAFRSLNLLEPWPMRGPFDVIFCRNVVIYFDKDTQRTLFDRMANLLSPGGWLFIGHSESLFRISDRFEHLGRTIYQKRR